MNEITQIKAKKISQLQTVPEHFLKDNGLRDLWLLLGRFSEDSSTNIIPTNYRINLLKLYETFFNGIYNELSDRINELNERIDNLNIDYVTKSEFNKCCDKVHQELDNKFEELRELIDDYHANKFEISYDGLSDNLVAFGYDGSSPRPTDIREGSTATIIIKPKPIQGSNRSGYDLPDEDDINVYGADKNWTFNDDGTAKLVLINPTSNISLDIPAIPKSYGFTVGEDEHAHLSTEDVPGNISYGDTIQLVYSLDNGYELKPENVVVENGTAEVNPDQSNIDRSIVEITPNGLGDQVNVQVTSTLREYSITPLGYAEHTIPITLTFITIANDENNPVTLEFRSDEGYKLKVDENDISGASLVPNSYTHDQETGISTIQICNPTGNVTIRYSSSSLMEVYFGVLHDKELFDTILDGPDETEWLPTGFAVPIEETGLQQYNECPIYDGVAIDFGTDTFYPDSILVVPKQFIIREDNPFAFYFTDGEKRYTLKNPLNYPVSIIHEKCLCDLGEQNGIEYYGLRFYNISRTFFIKNITSNIDNQ